MSLRLVTPAAAVQLLEELRAHLRLGTDRAEDDRLTRLLAAAVQELETRCDRQLLTATWDLTLDAFSAWIDVPRPPLQSVTWVKYYDPAGVQQTLPASTYVVSTPSGPTAPRGRITIAEGQSWPTTRSQADAVTVRFVDGYGATGDLPAVLQTSLLLLVEDLIDEHQGDRISPARTAAERLLAPYRTRALRAS